MDFFYTAPIFRSENGVDLSPPLSGLPENPGIRLIPISEGVFQEDNFPPRGPETLEEDHDPPGETRVDRGRAGEMDDSPQSGAFN